jgi:hypothetical protein
VQRIRCFAGHKYRNALSLIRIEIAVAVKKGRKSYLLRIDEELWNKLSEMASHELRSVNGQIELILRKAVSARRSKPED